MKLTLLTFLTCAAFGQHVASFDDRLSRISSAATDSQRQNAIDLMLNESQNIATEILIRTAPALPAGDQISTRIFEQNLSKIVSRYRSLRADTQTGAPGGSSGSTTLVLHPYLADLFGVSFESGGDPENGVRPDRELSNKTSRPVLWD